jgi:aminopeptidase N
VARQISRTVAKGGIEGLPVEQREALPELDMGVQEHRALFDEAMKDHPDVKDIEKYYQVQVIWDEAMAERSVSYLADRSPARKMVILAGQAHCHRSAIPARMKRRAPHLRIVSVRTRDGGPATEGDTTRSGYDFELLF